MSDADVVKQSFKDFILKITNHLTIDYRFHKTKGIDQFTDAGILLKSFTLENVREWLGLKALDVSKDNIILEIMDTLAQAGRIRIKRIVQVYPMRINNVGFQTEIGTAVNSWKGQYGSKLKDIKYYVKKKLIKTEIKGSITNIKARVEAIHTANKKRLDSKYGKVAEIESRLHREDVEDESKLKLQVEELLDTNKQLLNTVNELKEKARK